MNEDTYRSASRKATRRRGYVLGFTDDHGFGVYAMRTYRAGEIVMVASHDARRLGAPRRQAIGDPVDMLSRVNRSPVPNCGIHVTPTGAHDLVACRLIVPGAELTC